MLSLRRELEAREYGQVQSLEDVQTEYVDPRDAKEARDRGTFDAKG